jgi:hypothetical protein
MDTNRTAASVRFALTRAPDLDIETLVERWWADNFPGSPVARDTEAWNAAHAAKERLKALLVQLWRRPESATHQDQERSN